MALNSFNSKNSRYRFGGQTALRKPGQLGWWDRGNVRKNSSFTDITLTITPRYAGRPDLVAYDYLGSTTYMWLVLQYNNIVDINEEFVVGKELQLPAAESLSLNSALTNINTTATLRIT